MRSGNFLLSCARIAGSLESPMPLLVILRIALVNCPTLVCASTLLSFCSLVSCRLPRGACRAASWSYRYHLSKLAKSRRL